MEDQRVTVSTNRLSAFRGLIHCCLGGFSYLVRWWPPQLISYIWMYFVILRPQVSIRGISIFGLTVLFRWDRLFLLPNLPIYQNITNKTN